MLRWLKECVEGCHLASSTKESEVLFVQAWTLNIPLGRSEVIQKWHTTWKPAKKRQTTKIPHKARTLREVTWRRKVALRSSTSEIGVTIHKKSGFLWFYIEHMWVWWFARWLLEEVPPLLLNEMMKASRMNETCRLYFSVQLPDVTDEWFTPFFCLTFL